VSVVRDAWNVTRFVACHPANRGRRIRQLGRAVAFQIRGRVLHRPTIARIGDRMVIKAELHHAAESKAVYANPPDWLEMMVWRQRLHTRDVFVDVGANSGVYALWAADCGAEVTAVEPSRVTAQRLAANVAMNSAERRIDVRRVGIANICGTMKLATNHDTTNRLLLDNSPGEEIAVETLDTLLGRRTAAGVKIDVEGAERLVLDGAVIALREQRLRLLQLEWNECSLTLLGESRDPVVQILRNHGYVLSRPGPDGSLIPFDGSGYGPDVFAFPERAQQLG
jgi:FkbM family methyltransferase